MAPVSALIQRSLGGVSFVDDARNPGRGRDAADARRLRRRTATQGLPARLPAFDQSTAAQQQRRSRVRVRRDDLSRPPPEVAMSPPQAQQTASPWQTSLNQGDETVITPSEPAGVPVP